MLRKESVHIHSTSSEMDFEITSLVPRPHTLTRKNGLVNQISQASTPFCNSTCNLATFKSAQKGMDTSTWVEIILLP